MSDHQLRTVSKEPPVYPSQPEAQIYWVGSALCAACDEAALDIRQGCEGWYDFGCIEQKRGKDLIARLSHAHWLADRRGAGSFPRHALRMVHTVTGKSLPNLINWIKLAIENAMNEDDITSDNRSSPVQADIVDAARQAGRILAELSTSGKGASTRVVNMAQQINIQHTNATQQTDIRHTNIHVTVTPGPTQTPPKSSTQPAGAVAAVVDAKNELDSKLKGTSPKKSVKRPIGKKRRAKNPRPINLTEEDEAAYLLHLKGISCAEIARTQNVSKSGAWKRVKKAKDKKAEIDHESKIRSVRSVQTHPTDRRGQPNIEGRGY